MGRRSTGRGWAGYSRGSLSLAAAVLAFSLTAGVARAQLLPPGALEQLDNLVGSRVETFAVLNTQSGASGGTYASKVNDTDLAITRVTGRGDVAAKKPLGNSGILWSPMIEGGVGYSTFAYFHTEPIERSTTALSFESSSEWWFNELDVEWRMPLYLWGRQLRTGAYISRSDLFGGLEDSFKTGHFYQAGGRFVIDVQGLL